LPQLGLPRFFAIDSPSAICITTKSFSVVFLFYRKLLAAALLQEWCSPIFFPVSTFFVNENKS
jgi:hypothetical protein